jgi:hypothetical protein
MSALYYKMVLQKEECNKGRVLCGLYHNTQTFIHKADSLATDYGEDVGRGMQGIGAAVATVNPLAGAITGAAGVGLETYAAIRNEVGED